MSASVTPDSPWRCPPRISLDGFTKLLQTQGKGGFVNLGLLAERDPMAFYDSIRGMDVDPLYILAVFWHESQFGTDGIARLTRSWGNTRPPSFGAPQMGVLNNFSTYRDWLDGCKSTVGRLVEPTWVYYARERIRDIYDWPDGQVWAPAGDNNDPAGYLRAVVDFMNAHADQGAPPVTTIPAPPFRTDVRSTAFGGYGIPRKVEAIVNHRSNGHKAGDLQTLTTVNSATWYIDKAGTIYNLVDPDESPWTNGPMNKPDLSNPLIATWYATVNPNTRTETIEHENIEGESLTPEQWDSTVHLQAWRCQERGLPPDRTHIIGHYQIDSVNKPYCPGYTDAEWDALVQRIQRYGATTAPPANERIINGVHVHDGFLGLYSALEAAGLHTQTLGLPLEDERAAPFAGVDSCQEFERAWLLYQHDQNPAITVAHRMWWPQLEALA